MKRKEISSLRSDRDDEGTCRASKCNKMAKGVDINPLLLLADVAVRSRAPTPSKTIPYVPYTRTKLNVQVTRSYLIPVPISQLPPLAAIGPSDLLRPLDFITQCAHNRSMIAPVYPRLFLLPRGTMHSHDLPPHVRAAMGPYSLTVMQNSWKSSGRNTVPLTRTVDTEKSPVKT
jgi:hypothetical protein